MNYSVWENSLTHVVYRVSHSGDTKRAISGAAVIGLSLFFAGQSQVALADDSDLRAWLNSYTNV